MHDVERVVAARPGLGADRLPGHRDRAVEVVGHPERARTRCPRRPPSPTIGRPSRSGRGRARPRRVASAARARARRRPGAAGAFASVSRSTGPRRPAASSRSPPRRRGPRRARGRAASRGRRGVRAPVARSTGILAGLVEGLLAERDRLGDPPVVVADDRPQAERIGARRPRRSPSIAASRIRSASRYSDRSTNRHSAASRDRVSAARGSSAGVRRAASW